MEATQAVMQAYSAAVTYGPVYHGGRERCLVLDPRKAGTGVINGGWAGSCNASGGVYFTSERKNAEYFADPCMIERDERVFGDEDGMVYGEGPYCVVIYGEADEGRYINPPTQFASEDEAEKWMTDFIQKWNAAEPGDVVFRDDLIFTATLTMHNPLIVDSLDEFRKVEPTAKADGYDGIIAYDIFDGCMYSDVYVVFESKQITLI